MGGSSQFLVTVHLECNEFLFHAIESPVDGGHAAAAERTQQQEAIILQSCGRRLMHLVHLISVSRTGSRRI